MTTNYHLNDFIELDSKILEDLSDTADELLEVEHLDLDNREYLAKALFCLGRYGESIEQFKGILSLKADDEKAISLNPSDQSFYLESIYLMMDDNLEAEKKHYDQMLLYNPLLKRASSNFMMNGSPIITRVKLIIILIINSYPLIF